MQVFSIKLSFNQQFKTYSTLVYIACFRIKGDFLNSAPQANNGNLVLRLPIIIPEMDTPLTQPQKRWSTSLVYLYIG